jgi:recombination protein RecT
MAKKTVLKNTLSKWGILSIDIQNAVITDQSVVKNPDTLEVSYIDNEAEAINKEAERIQLMITDCNTKSELIELQDAFINEKVVLTPELQEVFNNRLNEVK